MTELSEVDNEAEESEGEGDRDISMQETNGHTPNEMEISREALAVEEESESSEDEDESETERSGSESVNSHHSDNEDVTEGTALKEGDQEGNAGEREGSPSKKRKVKKRKRPKSPTPPPRERKASKTIRLDLKITHMKNIVCNFNVQDLAQTKRIYCSKDHSVAVSETEVRLLPLFHSVSLAHSRSNRPQKLLIPLQHPPKKMIRRRVADRDEGYDETDPFVDNSEIMLDMPKFYTRPSREGFWVAEGPIELFSDK